MADTTLYPTADAYIREIMPNDNYGTSPYLIIRTKITDNHRVFLKFSLASLPAGATITLAKLRISCFAHDNPVAGVTDVQARRVADDSWIETGDGSITWNNQPAYGDVEDTKVPAVGWVEWDITSFVQAEFADDKVVSICLRCVEESYDNTTRGSSHRSREHDDEDPELYIEYTVPPTHHEKTLSESFGFLDKVPKGVTLHPLTENLDLLDKTVKSSSLLKTELLGLTDDYSRLWTAERVYSESFGLADSLEAYRQLIKILSELLGLSDLIQKHGSKNLTENFGLLDSYGRQWTVQRVYSELFGLLDSLDVWREVPKVLTEILGLSDSYSRVRESYRTYSESLGLKDSVSKSPHVTRTELLGLADFLKSYFPGISIITSLLSILERGMMMERKEIEQKLATLERKMKLEVEPE